MRPAGNQLGDVVRSQSLEEGLGAGAVHPDLAHVRDVEESGGGAHRAVLVDHSRVLHRHFPAGEGDQPPSGTHVSGVERRLPEGSGVGHRGPFEVSLRGRKIIIRLWIGGSAQVRARPADREPERRKRRPPGFHCQTTWLDRRARLSGPRGSLRETPHADDEELAPAPPPDPLRRSRRFRASRPWPRSPRRRPSRPLPGCGNPRAIARYLKLTTAQQDQTQSLRQALRTAVDPLQAQLEPIREQIDTALDAAAPNACSVGGLVVQADGIHDQIANLRDDFEDDFEALLTPDQLVKWQALQVVCRAQDVTTGA